MHQSGYGSSRFDNNPQASNSLDHKIDIILLAILVHSGLVSLWVSLAASSDPTIISLLFSFAISSGNKGKMDSHSKL